MKPTREQILAYYKDTNKHIERVRYWMDSASSKLNAQSAAHDLSKFSPQEADIYAVVVPQFKGLEYGTAEHAAVASKLGPAWQHHLEHNPHHPEYWESIDQMDLLYLLEMLCDWKAASERTGKFDIEVSLSQHDIEGTLANVLRATAARLGM